MPDPTPIPTPEPAPGRRDEVAAMFDRIAPRYDFLNRALSLGIDTTWRKAAVKTLKRRLQGPPRRLLDVATGTADLALAVLKLEPETVVGVDPSAGMLELGREKVAARGEAGRVALELGASESLPFEDDSFDGATVAFGVRNFEDLEGGLREMARVLRPGAPLVVLEFSTPTNPVLGPAFGFYFRNVLPRIGKLISGDAGAYTYLPESVKRFPEGPAFQAALEANGFRAVDAKPLTFGIATLTSALAR